MRIIKTRAEEKNKLKYAWLYFLIISIFSSTILSAQDKDGEKFSLFKKKIKLEQQGYGAVIGLERGQYTFVQLGGEYFFRKISLVKPRTLTFGANFQYNFGHNVLQYGAYSYYRQGRINLTYGLGVGYATDFEGSRMGITPQIGFKIIGLHLSTGAHLFVGNNDFNTYNKLFIKMNYYFPIKRKISLKKHDRK